MCTFIDYNIFLNWTVKKFDNCVKNLNAYIFGNLLI